MENTIDFDIGKQTSSFKLSKMSKGYNWEIKIYSDDLEEIQTKTKVLDDWARREYETHQTSPK